MNRSTRENNDRHDPGPGGLIPGVLGILFGLALLAAVATSVILLGEQWRVRVMASLPINTLSFIAFGIASALLATRTRWIGEQRRVFRLNLLEADDEILLLPDDALECRRRVRELTAKEQNSVLLRLLRAALQRARANWSAEDAATAVQAEAELIQANIDTRYAMIRYLTWAIPPIGFIGTVLGIGQAMGSFGAVSGDSGIDPMEVAAGYLHMAFDTTFVALGLSVILMYFFHSVQARDEELVIRSTEWCMRRFVYRMHIRRDAS